MGGKASAQVTTIASIYNFTDPIVDINDWLDNDIVKYSFNSPNSIAKPFAFGSETLGKIYKRLSINSRRGSSMRNIKFEQEIEILEGNGIMVLHRDETTGNTYEPFCNITWFE